MKYQVQINGKNFLISGLGKAKHGFYTTRFVESENVDEAIAKALDLVREELGPSVLNDKADTPMIFIEKVYERESFDGCLVPGKEFGFYEEKETD